jgi:hypothetical protein
MKKRSTVAVSVAHFLRLLEVATIDKSRSDFIGPTSLDDALQQLFALDDQHTLAMIVGIRTVLVNPRGNCNLGLLN